MNDNKSAAWAALAVSAYPNENDPPDPTADRLRLMADEIDDKNPWDSWYAGIAGRLLAIADEIDAGR